MGGVQEVLVGSLAPRQDTDDVVGGPALYVVAHAHAGRDSERPGPEPAIDGCLLERRIVLAGQREHSLRGFLRHPSFERESLRLVVVDDHVELRAVRTVARDIPRVPGSLRLVDHEHAAAPCRTASSNL